LIPARRTKQKDATARYILRHPEKAEILALSLAWAKAQLEGTAKSHKHPDHPVRGKSLVAWNRMWDLRAKNRPDLVVKPT
jgi:hypothetical protein